MEGLFGMCSVGVHPGKTTGAQWIIHKMCAMGPVREIFSSYSQHIENVISTTFTA